MSTLISTHSMMKIALGIEYNGYAYYGWQRQQTVPSVQATLEKALSIVADELISVQCAGRTDAGVHATGQVVHFETTKQRHLKAWVLGVNANLPDDIAIQWAVPVIDSFHARFSATARRYRYIIFNSTRRSAICPHGVSHYYQPLDETKMHQAAQYLLGEQDFSAFRAAQCQSHSPYRNVSDVSVFRYGRCIVVDIKANAFLHHMVRNIVGSLLEIGYGNRPIDWMAQLLKSKDRKQAAATAKAEGLYLVDVDYPSYYSLPNMSSGPFFMEMLS